MNASTAMGGVVAEGAEDTSLDSSDTARRLSCSPCPTYHAYGHCGIIHHRLLRMLVLHVLGKRALA